MNCSDYLAMLSTLPVEELDYGSARAHVTECRDCDRVTRVVVERERSMLVAYADLDSGISRAQVASHAMALSNRRRVAFYYKVVLGLAALATVLFMVASRSMSRVADARAIIEGAPVSVDGAEMLTETLVVRCGSPEAAAEILRTHLQGDARVTFRSIASPGFITIEASPQQMHVARDILARLAPSEGSCAVLAPEPTPPIAPVAPATLAPLAPIER